MRCFYFEYDCFLESDGDLLAGHYFAVETGLADCLEDDLAGLVRIESVILSGLHIGTCDDLGSALAYDDVSDPGLLAVMKFCA